MSWQEIDPERELSGDVIVDPTILAKPIRERLGWSALYVCNLRPEEEADFAAKVKRAEDLFGAPHIGDPLDRGWDLSATA